MDSEYVNKNNLIIWLLSQKYGYLLEDGLTWVNYGDLNDKFPYDEKDKQWELSRNRMIDKVVNMLRYGDLDEEVLDLNPIDFSNK